LIAPLATLTLLLLLSMGLEFLTFILLLILGCVIYRHRNPERISNFTQEGSILCPLDGKVKEIISLDNSPIDGKPGFEIVVEQGISDIAILRAPVTAKMSVEKLQRGAMLNAKSGEYALNENALIRFSSKTGDIMMKHTLGSWTRPLAFGIEGKISQNERYGYMLNGVSSIYLPSNSRVAIKEGMKLRAGESIIGFFS
jgi:phosphatidylserine decarboxylase